MAKCKNAGGSSVNVETYSGARTSPICTIGSRTDIKHIIEITNLRFFRADVDANGDINKSSYRAVEFNSPHHSDTAMHWNKLTNIGSSKSLTMRHVGLDAVGTGDEDITTTVTITWPTLGKTETVTIDITVAA